LYTLRADNVALAISTVSATIGILPTRSYLHAHNKNTISYGSGRWFH
jgi:hypothetical protein